LQNFPGVVAQGEFVQMLASAEASCENFPLGHDLLYIRFNEISETHLCFQGIFLLRQACKPVRLGNAAALYGAAGIPPSDWWGTSSGLSLLILSVVVKASFAASADSRRAALE
jgi:hypothetical protein